ncbi:hypothetical protein [Thiocystis violascens]|uniref:Uncharacterized protein n=1 Tax=Thiocystis violascens (strain ATCC 17096 / DSM 198 / 6111) TaxID=765911 RepID=I3Y8Q6_THIV6|nr:hypothetical protein [Thiocystis violascens]AFL73374.1 hypothetical protein Thivi_1366 [Thiocystis violascens DSM 198]
MSSNLCFDSARAVLRLSLGLAILCVSAPSVHAGTAGPDFVYTISPCRVLDTRFASGVFAGKLNPSEQLSIRVSNTAGTIVLQGGNPSGCLDIPNDATGVFINVIAVEASGAANNDLGIQPSGSSVSGTAINYNPGTFALNNGLLVGTCYGQFLYGFPPSPSNCTSDLTLTNGAGASAHIVIDVTGFTRNF